MARRSKPSKSNRWVIILTAVLLILFGGLIGIPDHRDHRLKSQAVPFIAAAESHRTLHGGYPDSLPIPTTPEYPDGELFYQREPDGSSIIWYGTILGESNIYDSKTGQWSE